MAQSRNDPSDRPDEVLRPFVELSRMLKQGRSWSGHERNCCFLNTGERRFADVSAVSGLDFPDDSRALAAVDWDHDGDLDLWISNRNAPRLRFLRNDTPSDNRFLSLQLTGNGADTNRDAIGARVEVIGRGLPGRLVRTLRAGEGFLAQSSKILHFGLGSSATVEKVVVTWPSRVAAASREEFTGFEVDHRYRLLQGSGRAEPLDAGPRSVKLEAALQEAASPSRSARIPLVTLLPMPRLPLSSSSRPPPQPGSGKALWINLWASWCRPCIGELQEITAREDEIRAAGLDVAAFSVDGIGDDRGDPARAAALLAKLGFPFFSDRASTRVVTLLQHIHDRLVPLNRPLPVPTSFLVDAAGRLAVIYKGAVAVDTVLADLEHSAGGRLQRFVRSAPLGGEAIDHPAIDRAALTAETKARFQFAIEMSRAGDLDNAVAGYREVVAIRPDFAEAHNNLALALVALNDLETAAQHYARALGIRPDFAEAHYNLGIVLEKRGDLPAAAARYEQALRLRPDYPRAHNTLGVVYARLGKLPAAAAQFELELRRTPEFAEAHNNLGMVHLGRGDLDEAAQRFETAVRLDPDFANARNNLGIVYRRRGDLEAAAVQYEHAVRLDPDFAEAHNNLGAVYMHQKKPRAAEDHFRRALRLRPDFEAPRKNLERVKAMAPEG